MIIFTIRSCVHRSRNAQFASINSARSKLINMVKVQLSRVMWESYNLALKKDDSGKFEQAFLIGNLISGMEEGKLILLTYLLTNSLERFLTFLPAICIFFFGKIFITIRQWDSNSIMVDILRFASTLVSTCIQAYSGNTVVLSPFILPFPHSSSWPLIFVKVGSFVFLSLLLSNCITIPINTGFYCIQSDQFVLLKVYISNALKALTF